MEKIERLTAVVGVDGAGKTSVAAALSDYLCARGLEVLNTHVPVEPLASCMRRVRTRGKLISFFGYSLTGAVSARYLCRQLDSCGSLVVVADRWMGDATASHISQGISPWVVHRFTKRLKVGTPQIYVLLECDLDERQRRMVKERGVLSASDTSHLQMNDRLRQEYRKSVLESGGIIVDTTHITIAEVVQQIINCSGLESKA